MAATERLEILWQVVHNLPVPLRKWNRAVPADLEAVCLKCLEKDPGRRYQTVAALAADLGRWMEGRPTIARPLGVWGRSVREVRRRRSAVLVGTLIVGCLWLAGTAAYLAARPTGQGCQPDPNERSEGAAGRTPPETSPRSSGATGAEVVKTASSVGAARSLSLDVEVFTIHAQETALLELLPKVEYDAYELAAEVRHDDATAVGSVGVYVGRVAYPRSPRDLHFLVHLTFNSVRAEAPVELPAKGVVRPGLTNRVDLALRLLADKDVDSEVSLGTRISGPKVPALGKYNNRWFPLSVRVSPAGVSATFGGERIELSRDEIAELIDLGPADRPGAAPRGPSIRTRPVRPQGGLGLFLRSGPRPSGTTVSARLNP